MITVQVIGLNQKNSNLNLNFVLFFFWVPVVFFVLLQNPIVFESWYLIFVNQKCLISNCLARFIFECVCVSNWDWNKENSPIVNGFRHKRQTRTLVNQSIIKCNKKLLWLLLFPIWSLNISCFCKNPHHSNAFKFDWFVINDCVV